MIIETKLHIPETKGNLVKRPHLLNRLDEGLDKKLTLLTAPAGYGKSTLLSEWTAVSAIRVAWVSLDHNDNQATRFWTHTIESLKRISPLFDEQTMFQYAGDDPLGDTLVATLINSLSRLSETIILVWDDFHIVEREAILKNVAYLLDRLPANVHIYMATRRHPSISLSRLRIEGSLNEIDMAELLFDAVEVEQFFNQCTNLTLSTNERSVVLDQTEGWAAGMRMAALSLERQINTPKNYQMSGRNQGFSDYFFEEVLSKQTQEIQDFLLKTSILQRINGELCDALIGVSRSYDILQYLERSSLFLISLDEQREWFRYHYLFQDFLLMQLQISQPNQIKTLHFQAGYWLEENGFMQEALDHYLLGESYEDALYLLHEIIPSLRIYERVTLYKWLNEIPDDLLLKKPTLFLTNLASLFLSGHINEATKKYWWAINKLERDASILMEDDVEYLHAGLDFLVAFRSFLEKDFESFILYSRKYLEKVPSGDLLIDFGFDRHGNHPAWDIYISDGSLQQAEKLLETLLDIWSVTNNKPFYAHLCMDYGNLLYEWNRLDEAQTFIRQSLDIGHEYGNVSLTTKASLMIAKIEIARNRIDEAEFRSNQLAMEIDVGTYPVIAKKIALFRAWTSFQYGDMTSVYQWLEKNPLRSTDEISQTMLDEYHLYVRVLAEEGKTEEATSLTLHLLDISTRERRQWDVIQFTALMSLLYAEQNRMDDSFRMLEHALATAGPDGYIRTFLDEGPKLTELVTQYVHAIQSNHYHRSKNVSLTYVKRLQDLLAIEAKIGPYSSLSEETVLPESILTPQEKTVLRLIHDGLANKEIARELDISLSTVKTHINNIYRKFGVDNRVLALSKAQELELL